MEIIEAIKSRHSVRVYQEKQIELDVIQNLQAEIDECNKISGLNIQLIINEPKAFSGVMAKYGKFSGVSNYIAIVGKKSKNFSELSGYYGERIVIKAQQLGLNTCWVALTYKKVPTALNINKGEKLLLVISLGYGKNQGVPRKSKTISQVSNATAQTPDWFNKGVEFALLAPTAMNQQKFKLTYKNGEVTAKAGAGFYAKVDLGIVKYHFEVASSKKIL